MEAIWKNPANSLDELNELRGETMAQWMGLQFTEVGADFLKATMPVDKRTHQPYGLLHGGASAALAETIGSVASALCIDSETQICVGMELNCNHIKAKRNGFVTATARPLHLGKTSHVWDIKITDEADNLICVSRLTVAILDKRR